MKRITKADLVIVSKMETDEIIDVMTSTAFNLKYYNTFMDYDAETIEDYESDAVLMCDFTFYNKCIDAVIKKYIIKVSDGTYLVTDLGSDDLAKAENYEEAVKVFHKINKHWKHVYQGKTKDEK